MSIEREVLAFGRGGKSALKFNISGRSSTSYRRN